jgi:surfeit locus 1 family protein
MTSEVRRFPVGLTLAAAVAIAIMCGLGVWQLQRAAWKERALARIAALAHAPPRPIGPVLEQAVGGSDVSFTRVVARCAPAAPAPAQFHMVSDNGDGSPNPPALTLPAPVEVVGLMFPRPAAPSPGLARPAPYVLAVEQETPPAPGVTPAPYPGGASEGFQYVGAYAPTWFGLAGVLACVYAAMLWRRFHPKS